VANELHVEAEGDTVGEAKWVALRELEKLDPGIDKSAVRFQVLSEGERGLLGVGYTPARVIATVDRSDAPAPQPAPRDESPLAAEVRELVETIAAGIGVRCRIDVRETDDAVTATCSGADLGLLIGKRGQTIDAIQYLVNAILFRTHADDRKSAVVDAAGYRARRRETVHAVATRSAERAVASGSPVELEPMTAVERKLVHERLKDVPGVQTRSEGTEPNRFVVVLPSGD
jgi:spoIIIJ-associated protein